MTREAGFYWVKYYGKWTVGEYRDKDPPRRYIVGDECYLAEKEFDLIGNKIPDVKKTSNIK